MQFIDQINYKFESNCFTLGIFKGFDTLDHQILISKLNNYGVNRKKLSWLKSYLENRKQYLTYSNDVTNLAQIKCTVSQGSILGLLLFLVSVNDLCNASNILDPIIFTDDTNLFLSHQNINTLFKIFNEELKKKLGNGSRQTKYT